MAVSTLAHDLRFSASLDAVGEARSTVAELLASHAWRDESAAAVILATSEAVCNAVEHGSEPGGEVRVRIRLTPETVEVRVRDSGRAEPGRLPHVGDDPPPDGQARGRGLVIMKALANELTLVAVEGGGTEACLVFVAAAAARSALPPPVRAV